MDTGMSRLKKDGILPALLQEGQGTVVPYLVRIFRASLAKWLCSSHMEPGEGIVCTKARFL